MGISTCFVMSVVVFTQILIIPILTGALELTTKGTAATILEKNQFPTKKEADVTVKVNRVEPTESMELEFLHPTPTQHLHTPSRMRRSDPISRIRNGDELIIGSAVINNEIRNEMKAPHASRTRTKGKVTQQNLGDSVTSGTGTGTGTGSSNATITAAVMQKLGSPSSGTARKSNLKSTDTETESKAEAVADADAEAEAEAEAEPTKLSDETPKRNPHRQSQSHYKQSYSNSNKAVVIGTPRKASNSRNALLLANSNLNSISQSASPSRPQQQQQQQQPYDYDKSKANNKKLRVLSLSESALHQKRNRIRRSSAVTQATGIGIGAGTGAGTGTETETGTGKTFATHHQHPQPTLSQVLQQAVAAAAAAASQKQSATNQHEENYSMQQQIKNPIEFQENHFTEPASASEALLGSWEDLPWNRNTNIRGHESEEDIFKLLSLIGSKEGVNFFPGNPFLTNTDMETESQRNQINSDQNSGQNNPYPPFNTHTKTNSHNDANIISGGTGNGNGHGNGNGNQAAKDLQNKSEQLNSNEYLNAPMKHTLSLASSSVEKSEMGKGPADANNNANHNANHKEALRFRDRNRNEILEDEDAYEDEPAIELSHHGDGFSRPKTTTIMADPNAPVRSAKDLRNHFNQHVALPFPIAIPIQQMMAPAPRVMQSAALASESPLLLLKSLLPILPMRQAVLFENEREDKDLNEEETPLSIYHHGMWRRRRSRARTQIPIEIDVGMGSISRNPNRFEAGTGTGTGIGAGFGELNIIRRAHNSLSGSSSAPDIFEMDGYFSSTPTLKATSSFSQFNNPNNRRFRFRSQNTQNGDRGPSLLSEASQPLSSEISFKPWPRQHQQLPPAPVPVPAPAPSSQQLLWHRHPLSLFDMDFENQKQNPQSSLALTNSDYFLGQLLQKAQQVVDPTLPLYHRFIL